MPASSTVKMRLRVMASVSSVSSVTTSPSSRCCFAILSASASWTPAYQTRSSTTTTFGPFSQAEKHR